MVVLFSRQIRSNLEQAKKKARKGSKKKGSKKKGKGIKKSKKAAPAVPAMTKGLYLLQIQDLSRRLAAAEEQCASATELYKQLVVKSAQDRVDMAEVIEFHKRQSGRGTEALATLKEKLFRQEEEARQTQERLESELETQRVTNELLLQQLQEDIAMR